MGCKGRGEVGWTVRVGVLLHVGMPGTKGYISESVEYLESEVDALVFIHYVSRLHTIWETCLLFHVSNTRNFSISEPTERKRLEHHSEKNIL